MNKFQQEMLDAALVYAKRGWRVLPVSPFNKAPFNSNGCRGASTDPEEIATWFHQYAPAGVGIATGPDSFFVVDVDVKDGKDGLQSLEERFREAFEFDNTRYLQGLTTSGGLHFLFQWQDGVKNATNVLPGIDIRGDGGYIVVSPTELKCDGQWKSYKWNDYRLPICPILPWVDELLEDAKKAQGNKEESGGQGGAVYKALEGAEQGERDITLYRYARHLKSLSIPIDLAISFITEAAARCNPPFNLSVAHGKIQRAYADLETDEERFQGYRDIVKSKRSTHDEL